MPTAHPSLGHPRPPSSHPPTLSTFSSTASSPPPPLPLTTSAWSSSSSSLSSPSYRLTPSFHLHTPYNISMKDTEPTLDSLHQEQQQQYPLSTSSSSAHGSPTYDHHLNQDRNNHYYGHSLASSSSHVNANSHHYNNHNHHEESPYYLEPSRGPMPYHYPPRGHRHSIDSAAADTLLMLSAAAFMDPDSIRMVTPLSESKHNQQGDQSDHHHHRSHRSSFVEEEHQHNHHRPIHHRPQLMAKTVSAPVSSSSPRPPLHPLSRMPRPRDPRDLVVEETTDMDVDVEPLRRPSISDSSSQVALLSNSRSGAIKCSTGTQTLITKGPGMRHHSLASSSSSASAPSATSSRHIPPTVISSSSTLSTSTTTTCTESSTSSTTPTGGNAGSNGRNGLLSTPVSSSSHGLSSKDTTAIATGRRRSSGTSVELPTTTRLSFTINKGSTGHRVMEEHEDVIDRPTLNQELEEELEEGEIEEEGEDEEDEVMSEGVVCVNNHLKPIALSAPNKVQVVPLILTSGPAFSRQQQQSHGHDSPKTPTSARTPRTPKQARTTPKTPRAPKRSQSDIIPVSDNDVVVGAAGNSSVRTSGGPPSGSGRGKSNARDSPVDYFYSPFPPSNSSPVSSPSSPSPFQLQLLQLTRNFVSVQPHASPTSRFRRTTSSGALSTYGILPFSPPTSPGQGQDLMRESTPTHASPTKSHGSHHSARGAHSHRSSNKPKWHTQPYMMFLALRAMPNRTAARQELIHAAVELDKKFSAEKGLPRVFTGKTPMNSASACLTNNGDKYFIPFKPEGSRSTHFRLAHQPCDFDTAVADYYGWMEELIRHDWPLCFGVPKNQGNGTITVPSDATATATVAEVGSDRGSGRSDFARADSLESRKRGPDSGDFADGDLLMRLASGNSSVGGGGASKKIKAAAAEEGDDAEVAESEPSSSFTLDEISSLDYHHSKNINCRGSSSKATTMGVQRLDLVAAGRLDEPNSCPPTPATATALALEKGLKLDDSPVISSTKMVTKRQLEDLDLSRVPRSLAEIVEIKPSTLPNAGKGLFAKIDIPAGTPLGFYFGMPMSENEFDSLKEGVGSASQYAIMYRRTVLDATDEQGLPFKLDNTTLPWEQQQQVVVEGQVEGHELLCPFYFLNEDQDGNVSLITGSVVNQVICTTNRTVNAGDELVVFFARESERHWPVAASHSPSAPAPIPKPVKPVAPVVTPTTSHPKTTRKAAAAAAAAAAAIAAGEASSGSEGSGIEGVRRPRRDTVYKPVRYSR